MSEPKYDLAKYSKSLHIAAFDREISVTNLALSESCLRQIGLIFTFAPAIISQQRGTGVSQMLRLRTRWLWDVVMLCSPKGGRVI